MIVLNHFSGLLTMTHECCNLAGTFLGRPDGLKSFNFHLYLTYSLCKEFFDDLNDFSADSGLSFTRGSSNMWSHADLGVVKDSFVLGGFFFEDIQGCCCHLAGIQSITQSSFIDEAASGSIDQENAIFIFSISSLPIR